MPLLTEKLSHRHCEPLVHRLCRKIEVWTNKYLSLAGRVQLIKTVLFGIAGYWSLYLFIPIYILKKIRSTFADFCGVARVNIMIPVNSRWLADNRWQFCPSNHEDGIEIRCLCAQITFYNRDNILWDNLKFVSISGIWHSIREVAARPSWTNFVWHNFVVLKFSMTLWLVIKNRLLTSDRMIRFNINVPNICLLYNTQDETHEHIFMRYTYSRQILSESPCSFTRNWDEFQAGNVTVGTVDNFKKDIAYLYLAAACHTIWREKNDRQHNTEKCQI